MPILGLRSRDNAAMLLVNTIEFFSRRISMKIEFRDGPLENLWGWGGGAGEVQKKYSRKRKLNEKNSCMSVNPKKYSCYGLKKIHTTNGPSLSSQRREKLLFLTTMAAVTSRANQQSVKVWTLPKFVFMHFNLD